jgi:sterol desaturase/sphingolipid hydroxylase (fatty acid hydroxylase superfamily)
MDGRAIAIAIPFFFVLIGVELLADRARRRRGAEPLYRFADSIGSLSNGIGQQVLQVLAFSVVTAGVYGFVFEHAALLSMPSGALGFAIAFVLVDLAYFVYHWASHRVNFFWAMHVVHHSSEEYNLSTALRQSWFTNLTSWIFYVPLAVLGVPTKTFVICLTLNILYQFWIHTRIIGKLGPLEWVFNTPSHHRVHHGIDPQYIDKNYAGVFIVWDRLFGTFTEEREEPSYGTVKALASFNPFWANVEGFASLAAMSSRTRRLVDKLRVWVAPPEWRPEDLGGIVVVPEVDKATRVKYSVRPGRAVVRYVAAQFLIVAALVSTLLWFKAELPRELVVLGAAVILSALAVWAGLLEARPWALWLERARLVVMLGGAGLATVVAGPWVAGALAVVALASLVASSVALHPPLTPRAAETT